MTQFDFETATEQPEVEMHTGEAVQSDVNTEELEAARAKAEQELTALEADFIDANKSMLAAQEYARDLGAKLREARTAFRNFDELYAKQQRAAERERKRQEREARKAEKEAIIAAGGKPERVRHKPLQPRQNDVVKPMPGTAGDKVWSILDDRLAMTGVVPSFDDVLAEVLAQAVTPQTGRAKYYAWMKFNGHNAQKV